MKKERLEWSLDGETWHPTPGQGQEDEVYVEGEGVWLDADITGLVQQLLVSDEFDEPLARQILMEAIGLRANPRAAVVLTVVAAEVGLKRFAASRGPEQAWLITELQSPPLVTLIDKYLPLLTDQRTKDGRVIPKRIKTTLHEAVERRNEIVHRGYDPPSDPFELSELFGATNDFLYMLDWFSGHAWAFHRIREDVQTEWPPPQGGDGV